MVAAVSSPPRLSALAPAFHPSEECMSSPDIHLCIFNNGVPSLVMASEADISDLLHGISDAALDEQFRPTAEEAAELELVQDFVTMMAQLDAMEVREERARVSFDHVQKRWESRRAQGLVGRPKPAKHSVEPVNHHINGVGNSFDSQEVSIVPSHHQRHARRMLMKHQTLHQKDLAARGFAKHTKQNHQGPRHDIQQPRKMN